MAQRLKVLSPLAAALAPRTDVVDVSSRQAASLLSAHPVGGQERGATTLPG